MTSTPDGPATFQLSTEPDGRTVILSATGDVDMISAPQLEEAARRALADAPPALVLDLSEVTFMSSAGLSVLVHTQKNAPAATEVRIVAAGAATLRPLQLMGLDQELTLFATREEALR
jgi:anti-sigma B factor antagonist